MSAFFSKWNDIFFLGVLTLKLGDSLKMKINVSMSSYRRFNQRVLGIYHTNPNVKTVLETY